MAAVSIQLRPRSTAWRIAAIDTSSSWGPQLKAPSVPPIAQAPKPTRVISRSVRPSRFTGSAVVMVLLLVECWSGCGELGDVLGGELQLRRLCGVRDALRAG